MHGITRLFGRKMHGSGIWFLSLNMLRGLLYDNLEAGDQTWLEEQLEKICSPPSARSLYLTYSLIGKKIPGSAVLAPEPSDSKPPNNQLLTRFKLNELARIFLLSEALKCDPDYFVPKVATLIQVSDTGELVTLLRYLMLLPHREAFCETAVEALRTNIATVFEAISMDNPYPRLYFNEQQWNQMYLKAAFMQLDLHRIQGVDERANASLARIISDYAHERWAASRDVDPVFWRPVSGFLDQALLRDMERLLSSDDPREQQAGYLCCLNSENKGARSLISTHPLQKVYDENPFHWKDI